jgi:hypothetical protein
VHYLVFIIQHAGKTYSLEVRNRAMAYYDGGGGEYSGRYLWMHIKSQHTNISVYLLLHPRTSNTCKSAAMKNKFVEMQQILLLAISYANYIITTTKSAMQTVISKDVISTKGKWKGTYCKLRYLRS